MTSREIYKTAAIVLSAIDYGESDRIVSFYSTDFGKMKGIAKGAKRSRKRFANALEPFTKISLTFSRYRIGSLAFVENCFVEEHFASIRGDFTASLLGAYMVELVERFTLEGKPMTELFDLLADFLFLLGKANGNPERIVRIFEIKFLKMVGYEPQLSFCVRCQMPIVQEQTALRFDHTRGGVVCPSCQSDGRLLACSAGTRKTMLAGRDISAEMAPRLFFAPLIAKECEEIMAVFIRYLLGKELRSVEVLRQVKNLQRALPAMEVSNL
ncbi:MAG: DNA repair protein RecO [Deltaproteobacteria bacterium]|nr:DNA repair protein RecO [Deltaproteobacteria bacterium]